MIIATGAAIGLFKYKRLESEKPVAILLVLTFFSETLSRIFAFYFINSSPVYHFLDPLQSILWGIFFFLSIKSRIKKKVIFAFSILLTLYAIFDSFFVENILKFPDIFLTIQSIALICFGFVLFFEKLDSPANDNIFKDSVFLISLSVIWFYLISFLFFDFHEFSLSKKISQITLRTINYISNYVYYLLLIVALILKIISFKVDKNE